MSVSEISVPFTLTENDVYATFKAWFLDFNSNTEDFLDLDKDFTGEDGADKYAAGATKDFLNYVKQIKGE